MGAANVSPAGSTALVYGPHACYWSIGCTSRPHSSRSRMTRITCPLMARLVPTSCRPSLNDFGSMYARKGFVSMESVSTAILAIGLITIYCCSVFLFLLGSRIVTRLRSRRSASHHVDALFARRGEKVVSMSTRSTRKPPATSPNTQLSNARAATIQDLRVAFRSSPACQTAPESGPLLCPLCRQRLPRKEV